METFSGINVISIISSFLSIVNVTCSFWLLSINSTTLYGSLFTCIPFTLIILSFTCIPFFSAGLDGYNAIISQERLSFSAPKYIPVLFVIISFGVIFMSFVSPFLFIVNTISFPLLFNKSSSKSVFSLIFLLFIFNISSPCCIPYCLCRVILYSIFYNVWRILYCYCR